MAASLTPARGPAAALQHRRRLPRLWAPAVSLSGLAEALQALPAAELRAMAGIRRRCSRAEAVAAICALPI